jgi:hypothetical protein
VVYQSCTDTSKRKKSFFYLPFVFFEKIDIFTHQSDGCITYWQKSQKLHDGLPLIVLLHFGKPVLQGFDDLPPSLIVVRIVHQR